MHQINSNTLPTIVLTNLKGPHTITQHTLLELIIVYLLLNQINLNTEFQSEAPHCAKILQSIQKKGKKRPISLKV